MARAGARSLLAERRALVLGAAAFLHMDFSLYSSPCAFRERCSDPLPEAGLTKAKLKYRNERIEKNSTRPQWAEGGGQQVGSGGAPFYICLAVGWTRIPTH